MEKILKTKKLSIDKQQEKKKKKGICQFPKKHLKDVSHIFIPMPDRYWKQKLGKTHYANSSRQKKSRRNSKHKDEMKHAFKDEESLKRKIKRLTIDWFFRPGGD